MQQFIPPFGFPGYNFPPFPYPPFNPMFPPFQGHSPQYQGKGGRNFKKGRGKNNEQATRRVGTEAQNDSAAAATPSAPPASVAEN